MLMLSSSAKDLNCEYRDIFQMCRVNSCSRILRPNTPYRVLTVQSSIYAGGLFYNISNITESCIGVMQSFIGASTLHRSGTFQSSRLLLARMLIYLHQQYVLDAITETGPSENSHANRVHLPDLETMDGILAVLSLINIAELANVLHPDTYQDGVDPEERMFLIHVRKQGRHLLHWLENHYAIEPTPCAGTLLSTVSRAPHLANLYLVHQVRALQDAKMSMERAKLQSSIPGLTYQALYSQIRRCLGHQVNEIQGHTETFAWQKGTHQVSQRSRPLLMQFRECT